MQENTHDFLGTLRSCYAPNATFVDNLVVAHPRSSIELQFYALHKIFSQASVEVGELKGGPVRDGYYAGLWQASVDFVTAQNTQQYRFSRTTKISQQVLPDDVRLEVTTTLTIDPQSKQVVRHEDEWDNVGPQLPMLWRRLNAGITNAVFRWLGWGKELQLQAARQAPSYGGID
ncbi:hypothetical protein N2152v2_003259 [Parachlorella kessleri]